MHDKTRANFEAWCKFRGLDLSQENGHYTNVFTDLAWASWKAGQGDYFDYLRSNQ